MDCNFGDANGVVSCVLGYRGGGGAKFAVVVSSDVDHAQEALDFIYSWQRFPPCPKPPQSGNDTRDKDVDRELRPSLVLRMSCDWGLKHCELAVQTLVEAADAHMHCFSALIPMMNIAMFRKSGSGSTIADCFECVL